MGQIGSFRCIFGHMSFLGEDKAETFSRIAALDYEFDEEDFAGISHEAKQFIEQLFTRDPLKRATAKQCLHHDWVIKFSPKNMPEIKVEPVQDRREVMEMERRKQWEEGKWVFRAPVGRTIGPDRPGFPAKSVVGCY